MTMKVKDIATLIEHYAPLQLQESYDNAGLQLGNPEQEVTGIVTTLDVTEATVALAIDKGANLIVSHHPLLFRATKQINPQRDYISRVIISAIKHDIAVYSAHTNLDNAPEGVNDRIARLLGLTDTRPLAQLPAQQTSGLPADYASRCGSGKVGDLPEPMTIGDFASMLKNRFHIDALQGNVADMDKDRKIRRVALCGGAGDEFIADAIQARADVFVTGEVSYHLYFGHPEILVLCGGHFETEQYTADLLRDIIVREYRDLPVTIGPKSSPVVTL